MVRPNRPAHGVLDSARHPRPHAGGGGDRRSQPNHLPANNGRVLRTSEPRDLFPCIVSDTTRNGIASSSGDDRGARRFSIHRRGTIRRRFRSLRRVHTVGHHFEGNRAGNSTTDSLWNLHDPPDRAIESLIAINAASARGWSSPSFVGESHRARSNRDERRYDPTDQCEDTQFIKHRAIPAPVGYGPRFQGLLLNWATPLAART